MGFSRRQFLGFAWRASLGAAAVGYPLWEARDLLVSRFTLPVPRLPKAFEGLKVAFLADIHYGPFLSLAYVREAVDLANSLGADVALLGGDYVYKYARYIAGVMPELARLQAPLGVCAVKGNHDNDANRVETSRELERNGIREITNGGVWLQRGSARFRLGGVDDCGTSHSSLDGALDGVGQGEGALILTHNPDFSEGIRDPRVSMVLCGHTHGGQVHLPFVGSPIVPSAYGQKYLYGLVAAPNTPVFVTRGVGTIFPPVRINCPPEVALLTLAAV